MNETIELVADILSISGCIWLLISLFIVFRINGFIVRRYEDETSLLQTVFFKDYVTFTRGLPNFFSSACYGAHLMMCTWGWSIYGKKKVFCDIQDPGQVTKHFSDNEIRRVKILLLCGLIILLHAGIYLVYKFFWPGVFI